jgi:WD40 repeat protein
VVDVASGQVLGQFNEICSEVFFPSPDVVVGSHRGAVRQYDAANGKTLSEFQASDDGGVTHAALAKGGKEVVLGMVKTGAVRVFDLATKKLLREFPLPGVRSNEIWFGYVVSPDGKWIAVQQGGDPVRIFDGMIGALVATLWRGSGGYESLFVPGRDIFLTPSNVTRPDKSGNPLDVVAYDVRKQVITAAFRGQERGALVVAVSADGRVLAVGNKIREVLIWDLTELK